MFAKRFVSKNNQEQKRIRKSHRINAALRNKSDTACWALKKPPNFRTKDMLYSVPLGSWPLPSFGLYIV